MALRVVAVLVAALLIALLTYGLVTQAPDATIDDALARGEATTAPGFELAVLQPPPHVGSPTKLARATRDGRLSLDELRGTPIALNFWASWCEPCRAEAEVLERGWRRASGQGAIVLGLNMQDVSSDARRFLREVDATYPSVREPDEATAREYGTTGLPETFFISGAGQVVGHVIGAIDDEQLAAGLRAARSGRPTELSSGGARRKTR